MKNKDIAREVKTTEQVVKNYLRKIYDKLNVADRLELALYSMHHRLLDGYVAPNSDDGKGKPAAPPTEEAFPMHGIACPSQTVLRPQPRLCCTQSQSTCSQQRRRVVASHDDALV